MADINQIEVDFHQLSLSNMDLMNLIIKLIEENRSEELKPILPLFMDNPSTFQYHFDEILNCAIETSNLGAISLILSFNGKYPDYSESFNFAASTGSIEIISLFLENCESTEQEGWKANALVNASESGNLEMVRFLLRNGADPEYPFNSYQNVSCVESAIRRGHLEVLKELLESGADPNGRVPYETGMYNTYYSTLNCAINFRHLECIRLILENGANLESEPTEFEDSEKNSLVFSVLHRFTEDDVDLEIIRLLTKYYSHKDITLAAYCAAFRNFSRTLNLLLRSGADLPVIEESLIGNLNLETLKVILLYLKDSIVFQTGGGTFDRGDSIGEILKYHNTDVRAYQDIPPERGWM